MPVSYTHLAQHKAQDHRSHTEASFDQQEADRAEDHDEEQVVVGGSGRIDAADTHDDDKGHQDLGGDGEDIGEQLAAQKTKRPHKQIGNDEDDKEEVQHLSLIHIF